MSHIPSEFNVGGIYLPPSLVAGCLGVLLAYWTSRELNRRRLSRHLFYPPLVFVALTVLYTIALGYLLIAF